MNKIKYLTALRRAALLTITVVLSACSGTYKSKVEFNVREPLRIAVLPFVSKDSSGKIVEQEGRLFVDNISLISSKVEETPPQLVRREVIEELKKTSLDLVSPALIDIDLPHHGFAAANGKLDLARVWQVKPSELCGSFLSCDAVLYGTVTEWDRSYYAIESVNSVGVELSLVSAKNGKELFHATGNDSESRGITKIPTGISSVVLEPIKGLDSEIIAGLAESVVQKMLEPLVVSSRPQFVDTSPPAIFGASHDGAGRKITERSPLLIVMFASEAGTASFSIGDTVQEVPMIERSPGHYYGEYYPLTSDSFNNQEVTVALVDAAGRKSVSKVALPGISYP